MERVRSGIDRLDAILGGGLPANAINLIIGEPGTGKTILADQYVFHNATEERPGLYYTTVAEPYDKLLRYGQRLRFFDVGAVGRRVYYDSLTSELRTGGLDGVLNRVAEDIKSRRPGVIAIDSFRALSAFATEREFRSFLADLGELLTAFPATAFWLGEYRTSDIASAPEFAVADAIIALLREDTGLREHRYVQVLKLRGSGFLAGKHGCRITDEGIAVYPRLADPGDPSEYQVLTRRTPFGIDALDLLVDDGFLAGSSTVVAGPSGSGKTLLGLHFIFAGARNGDPGVIAGFQENPSQLGSIARGFGWSLGDERVRLLYSSAVGLYVDEWLYTLLDTIEETGARRVLVDSLADLSAAAGDPIRFREFVYSLIQRCTRMGVSIMFTLELPELFKVGRLSEGAFSHLADNVVLLQYVLQGGVLGRALTLVKSRGTRHDPTVRQFEITQDGIVLGGPFPTAAGALPQLE